MSRSWHSTLGYAGPITLFILGLFYYWYAVADRYAVFLYEHLGATPFDQVTGSRYWMAGLVAAGAVTVFYTTFNGLLGRRRPDYRPPQWWQIWSVCFLPLVVGIPLITMTFNQPVLPPTYAAAATVATLVGLALALMPGRWAARRPVELGWLILDGLGLVPVLLLLRVVELPGRGLVSRHTAYLVAAGAVLASILWLAVMTGLRRWRDRAVPEAGVLLAAGISLNYLVLPLVHHLLATPPGYRYITTASNFFAFNPGLQLFIFLGAVILAMGVTYLRKKWLPQKR